MILFLLNGAGKVENTCMVGIGLLLVIAFGLRFLPDVWKRVKEQ